MQERELPEREAVMQGGVHVMPPWRPAFPVAACHLPGSAGCNAALKNAGELT